MTWPEVWNGREPVLPRPVHAKRFGGVQLLGIQPCYPEACFYVCDEQGKACIGESHPLPLCAAGSNRAPRETVPFMRIDIDLANRPDWFRTISPLGKVPLLLVGQAVVFESAVILEYLEDTQPHRLHPTDPLARAEHRSWIEFGSSILSDIWVSTSRKAKRHSMRKPRSSKRSLAASMRASATSRGSLANASVWSIQCSARCSAISMPSTASAISASSPACRRSPLGGNVSRNAHRSGLRYRPSIRSTCGGSYRRANRISAG
jgi:hypothetical protein